jgi:hypothetical protein
MDSVFHALHVLPCDASVEVHVYLQGRKTFVITYDGGGYRIDHDPNGTCNYVCVENRVTAYEVMAWMILRHSTTPLSHVCLYKLVRYKDANFRYSNECRIPIWDSPS